MSCEIIGSTLALITSLTHQGARPSPATAAMRQITARRSSQVASVSFRCSGFWQVPYNIFPDRGNYDTGCSDDGASTVEYIGMFE